MYTYNYDVIIVGAGLTGIYTALNIDSKFKILLVSKGTLTENNSYLAQGGIAAVLSEDDHLDSHINDTLKAGSNLNNREALEILVSKAGRNIELLEQIETIFDRDEDGNYVTTLEGGHSFRRILHAGGDATGKVLLDTLIARLHHRNNIDIFENTMVVDLLMDQNKCIGIELIKNQIEYKVYAPNTMLATGGVGGVYNKTTNSDVATGDGIAIAHRAGAKIENMEFIQFHPTVFYEKKRVGKQFLISEAVRGEGAYLLNSKGERFMRKYHADLELAPRDVVSKAIFNEMSILNDEFVYIDIRHRNRDFLKNRFPSIFNHCIKQGLDMSKDLIPVAPAEHYSIGGIIIDIKGKTSIENLYASGECSNTGVHGANRLASNSLLECLVFGRNVAKTINKHEEIIDLSTSIEQIELNKQEINYEEEHKLIRETMQQLVGIVRSKDHLTQAKYTLERIYDRLKTQVYLCKDYYEVLNMVTTALLITNSALARKDSIGCHYRID